MIDELFYYEGKTPNFSYDDLFVVQGVVTDFRI